MASLAVRSDHRFDGRDADFAGTLELAALLGERTFRRGRFPLASGRESRIYFNVKTTMMDPRGALLCAEGLLHVLDRLDFDYMTGLEMGAVPLLGAVAAISQQRGNPYRATFVRKKPKAHGTQLMIEGLVEDRGETLEGKLVALIDDVATSGGSIFKAVQEVRRAGGRVTDAIVILDREEGAREYLAAEGIALHTLVTATDLGVTPEDRLPL